MPPNHPPPSTSALFRYITGKCENLYCRVKETLGYHKRDIVVYRVEEARDSLENAKSQFESALEKFTEIADFQAGSLVKKYLQLKQELEYSETRAKLVRDSIRAVEDIAELLFDEWEKELAQYANRRLRGSSRQQLKLTRRHYKKLIKAMHQAEDRVNPVLAAFNDQVLFLKHNLNAQAISSLHHELRSIGIDIASLITAMEKSIVEANTFVNSLGDQKALPSS